ncbi:hypothetical protein BJX65DRAFT_290875 [Aspergillus insuetus]
MFCCPSCSSLHQTDLFPRPSIRRYSRRGYRMIPSMSSFPANGKGSNGCPLICYISLLTFVDERSPLVPEKL